MTQSIWKRSDLADLRQAVRLLETSNFFTELTDFVGPKVAKGMRVLPKKAKKYIDLATEKSLIAAAKVAFFTLKGGGRLVAGDRTHKFAVASTGAAGGFFSWLGLVIELPVTTVVMLRSIADIAKAEQADIADPRIQMECLAVLTMGAANSSGEDESYYAGRFAFAQLFSQLGQIPPRKGGASAAKKLAEWLSALVARLLPRYAPMVTEKAIAQAAPFLGAVGGAVINSIFMNHFQNKAHGHFVVLRLEKTYGIDAVKKRYERYAAAMRDASRK